MGPSTGDSTSLSCGGADGAVSDGPANAPLVLVGRDYGFEEARVGRPFVGPAGKLLDRALAKAGLRREELLVTNVVNKKPANNQWEAHSAEDIDRGLAELEHTLHAAPRTLLVALGAEAFQACRGKDPREPLGEEFDGNGITELRGYVFDGRYGPVLACTHPAFVLRTWLPWWPCLCWDLAKAKRYVDGWGGAVVPNAGEYVFDGGPPFRLAEADVLAVDIETVGEHAEEIKCVGFAPGPNDGWATRFNSSNRDAVAELLASPARKVFHNGQFDVTILEKHGLHVNNWTDDTMLLWHTLEPLIAGRSKDKNSQTQKSLRFLASIFTDEPFWKSYDFQSDEEQLRLCAKDARITWQLWHKLTAMLASTGASPASTSPPPAKMSACPS